MTKHTPGPWTAKQTVVDPIVVALNGTRIAAVRTNEWLKFSCSNATAVLNSIEESKANASLIASAPDLLAALHHALSALDDAKKLHPNWIYSDAQNAARSAIDKAEGRTA